MVRNILIGVGVLALLRTAFFAASDAISDRIQFGNISSPNFSLSFSSVRVQFEMTIQNQLDINLPGTSFIGVFRLGTQDIGTVDIQNINLVAGQDNKQFVTAEIPYGRLADNIISIIQDPSSGALTALAGLTLSGNLMVDGTPIPVSKRLI